MLPVETELHLVLTTYYPKARHRLCEWPPQAAPGEDVVAHLPGHSGTGSAEEILI